MRRQNGSSAVWASAKRFLLIALTLSLLIYLGYHLIQYLQVRRYLPVWMTVGGLDAGGLTLEQAGEKLTETYMSPVILLHQDEPLEMNPVDAGFVLDVEGMLTEAEAYRTEQEFWKGYFFNMIGWSWEPMSVPLKATHDEERVRQVIGIVAGLLDEPATGPQILSENSTFQHGRPGFVTDVEASLPLVEEALYRPENRVARLTIAEQEAGELDFQVLEGVIRGQLQQFDGLGIVYIEDLQTGEKILINSDVAISGTSVLKIAVFIEAYRALGGEPNEYVQGLFYDTAVLSSNFGANLLLHVVAGEDNTYRGADILTESMRRLGLPNTFMAVPYDAAAPPHRPTTYVTDANSRADATEDIDPTMQSTAEEIGSLLSMLYYCSKGGGTLLAVYPEELTPQECQAIIDLMVLNEEGNLIRFGVPDGVPVSHKHGWARGTHADAGIVLSPGGAYVVVEYLHRPGEWLQTDESFPILREISRAVYNYFNFADPYLGDALLEAGRFGENDPPSEANVDDSESAVLDDTEPNAELEAFATPESVEVDGAEATASPVPTATVAPSATPEPDSP